MNLKLFCSDPVEALREQVRAAAMKDARFNKTPDDKTVSGNCWVADLIAPDLANDIGWKAIIQASDGKLFEVPFSVQGGVVKLTDQSREVFRSVRYLPLAAKQSNPDAPVMLRARDFSTQVSSADSLWMFAPGGVHTITCGAGNDGGAAEVTLKIDEGTATVLNASLAKINAEHTPQRAFIDKEHDEASGAAAWPEKFIWSDSPQSGVYLQHTASDFGKQLVDGKIIRAFSPSFYSDAQLPKKVARNQMVQIKAGQRGSPENPARMIGLVFPACGTLTNNPAFKKILPLWANNAAGARSSKTTTENK